jgi:hypothetical protein
MFLPNFNNYPVENIHSKIRTSTVHNINIQNFYCYANKKSHHIKVFVQLK